MQLHTFILICLILAAGITLGLILNKPPSSSPPPVPDTPVLIPITYDDLQTNYTQLTPETFTFNFPNTEVNFTIDPPNASSPISFYFVFSSPEIVASNVISCFLDGVSQQVVNFGLNSLLLEVMIDGALTTTTTINLTFNSLISEISFYSMLNPASFEISYTDLFNTYVYGSPFTSGFPAFPAIDNNWLYFIFALPNSGPLLSGELLIGFIGEGGDNSNPNITIGDIEECNYKNASILNTLSDVNVGGNPFISFGTISNNIEQNLLEIVFNKLKYIYGVVLYTIPPPPPTQIIPVGSYETFLINNETVSNAFNPTEFTANNSISITFSTPVTNPTQLFNLYYFTTPVTTVANVSSCTVNGNSTTISAYVPDSTLLIGTISTAAITTINIEFNGLESGITNINLYWLPVPQTLQGNFVDFLTDPFNSNGPFTPTTIVDLIFPFESTNVGSAIFTFDLNDAGIVASDLQANLNGSIVNIIQTDGDNSYYLENPLTSDQLPITLSISVISKVPVTYFNYLSSVPPLTIVQVDTKTFEDSSEADPYLLTFPLSPGIDLQFNTPWSLAGTGFTFNFGNSNIQPSDLNIEIADISFIKSFPSDTTLSSFVQNGSYINCGVPTYGPGGPPEDFNTDNSFRIVLQTGLYFSQINIFPT